MYWLLWVTFSSVCSASHVLMKRFLCALYLGTTLYSLRHDFIIYEMHHVNVSVSHIEWLKCYSMLCFRAAYFYILNMLSLHSDFIHRLFTNAVCSIPLGIHGTFNQWRVTQNNWDYACVLAICHKHVCSVVYNTDALLVTPQNRIRKYY